MKRRGKPDSSPRIEALHALLPTLSNLVPTAPAPIFPRAAAQGSPKCCPGLSCRCAFGANT